MRLDARARADYGHYMTRPLFILLLLAFSAPLSGCGIKGEIKTPPPLWGEEADTETPPQTAAETATETDPFADPLDEDEDEDVGYGIDVADQP